MSRNRSLTLVVIVLVVVGLAVVRHKRVSQKKNAPLLHAVPTAVQVAAVRQGRIESAHHVLGEVDGNDEAESAPRVVATVEEVLVREGERVGKGQVLARLDPREFQEAVSQAEANVEAARVAQEAQVAATGRDKTLFEAEAISQEQWERSQAAAAAAEARLRVAQERLRQARTHLGYSVLRSPFEGVVSARLADPGDLAVLGHPLLKVVRQRAVRVRAKLPPDLTMAVEPGTPVDLTLPGEQLRASVSRVFPAMQGSHLGTIEIDVAEPPLGFVAGATVGVDLHLEGGEGLLVPLDALLEGDNGAHVFKLVDKDDGSHAIEVVDVIVTTRSLDEAIVQGDLRNGDEVVVARPSRLMSLSEGMVVQPMRFGEGS